MKYVLVAFVNHVGCGGKSVDKYLVPYDAMRSCIVDVVGSSPYGTTLYSLLHQWETDGLIDVPDVHALWWRHESTLMDVDKYSIEDQCLRQVQSLSHGSTLVPSGGVMESCMVLPRVSGLA